MHRQTDRQTITMLCTRYRDVSNFKESHSAAWGALTSRTHRALYARLDSQARAA